MLLTLFMGMLHFLPQAATADSSPPVVSPQGKRITQLHFNGNHVTKTEVIKLYLALDTGMIYDSSEVARARKRVQRTDLFSKVVILSVVKDSTCELHVVVSERGYLHVPLPGLYQYAYKYGHKERWFSGDAGIDLENFNGRMERLRLMLRAWEWRTFSIGWTKPFLPSHYFIGAGLYADQRPDEFFDFDRTELSGRLSVGTQLFTFSKISLNVMPMFRQATWHDSIRPNDYYQAYGSINWTTDRRETMFDPSQGWVLGLETRSNWLYFDDNTPYVQQALAFNFYLPGFFGQDKFACRILGIVRDKNAGYLNRLGIGGEGSVRGYGRNVIGLGLSEIPNNCGIISAEYRFTLFTLFPIPVPFSSMVAPFIGNQTSVTPRIDGALIADYGRIAPRVSDLFHTKGESYQSGTGIGFGLRLIEPVLQLCGCIDVVFADNTTTSALDFYPIPAIHMYTNLPF